MYGRFFPKTGKSFFNGQMMDRDEIERIKSGRLPEKWERLGIKKDEKRP